MADYLFITGSHAHSVLWQARDPGGGEDLFFFFFFACQLSIPNQTRVCIWMFLVRYIMTGCIFRGPSALWQGQVLTPPPPSAAPPVFFVRRAHYDRVRFWPPPPPPASPPYPLEKSSAPPPPGFCRGAIVAFSGAIIVAKAIIAGALCGHS